MRNVCRFLGYNQLELKAVTSREWRIWLMDESEHTLKSHVFELTRVYILNAVQPVMCWTNVEQRQYIDTSLQRADGTWLIVWSHIPKRYVTRVIAAANEKSRGRQENWSRDWGTLLTVRFTGILPPLTPSVLLVKVCSKPILFLFFQQHILHHQSFVLVMLQREAMKAIVQSSTRYLIDTSISRLWSNWIKAYIGRAGTFLSG